MGSLYKIVAKILSLRIKEVMNQIIDESQFAFVRDRQILDGVLIANEAISWLKKRNKEGILLKIDFQSAYDSVLWDFIDHIMQEMGFGHKWRKWVMSCISTPSISILLNGTPLRPVRMEKGLR